MTCAFKHDHHQTMDHREEQQSRVRPSATLTSDAVRSRVGYTPSTGPVGRRELKRRRCFNGANPVRAQGLKTSDANASLDLVVPGMVLGMDVTGMTLLAILLWLIPVLVLYVVIRLAVRHGIQDAHRKRDR